MLEERVGDAEIALGIFKIDRIDLMRHDRGAGLALDTALAEIADRNVAPHVATETEQNSIDAGNGREHLCDKIVALDLRGERIPHQPESLNEILRQLDPID